MIKELMHDPIFLAGKSERATKIASKSGFNKIKRMIE